MTTPATAYLRPAVRCPICRALVMVRAAHAPRRLLRALALADHTRILHARIFEGR